VWPHDNALCAAGLMRYGLVEEAHRVMQGMIEAAGYFGNRMPELFAGFSRDEYAFPVAYPTSCSPQAWAAASPLLLLRALLRFEPDTRNHCANLAPAVPDWLGGFQLDRIPLMGGHLAIEVEGNSIVSVTPPKGIDIVDQPRPTP